MKKYLLASILVLTTLLQADYVMKYQIDGDEQIFMYHSESSSKLINSSEGEKNEIYKIGKKTYLVSYEGTNKTVLDMDEMRKMSQSFGYDASQYKEEIQKPQFKIKKTGKKMSVGGIKGEVWIVSGNDNGEKFTAEMVVSKDVKVVKTVRAMFGVFTSMSGDSAEDNFLEIQKGYVTIKADGMELKSFQDKKVPSSQYQLSKDTKKQKVPDFSKMKTKVIDSCYTQVCCGKTSGESKILASSLSNSFKGYSLVGSGVCDALGIASLLGIKSIEGALYSKNDDYIQVTLNMDDSQGGMLRDTKKNLDAGHSLGMVNKIKNYSDKKKINGVQVIQGELLPMKQETIEYIINSKTSLTISRIKKNSKGVSLMKVVSSDGGLNLKKLQDNLQNVKASEPQTNKIEEVDVDAAMNLLKSFF